MALPSVVAVVATTTDDLDALEVAAALGVTGSGERVRASTPGRSSQEEGATSRDQAPDRGVEGGGEVLGLDSLATGRGLLLDGD